MIDVEPVSIKGEKSNIGMATGAIIGGLVGSTVGDGVGRQVAIVAGTVAGGVIGYFVPVKLGEHNGFQYTIVLDETKKPILVIQGVSGKEGRDYKVGDRVCQIMIIPHPPIQFEEVEELNNTERGEGGFGSTGK